VAKIKEDKDNVFVRGEVPEETPTLGVVYHILQEGPIQEQMMINKWTKIKPIGYVVARHATEGKEN
jgi:hypothetical protein